MKDVPVYLFLGFLESGKTKFIQETLEDTRFNQGEKTVILLCEEGIEEYDLSAFHENNVFIESVDGEEELTAARLAEIEKLEGEIKRYEDGNNDVKKPLKDKKALSLLDSAIKEETREDDENL